MNAPDYYTPEEIATRWNVTTMTVYRWLKARKMAFISLPGGQYRIPREEVERREQGVRAPAAGTPTATK